MTYYSSLENSIIDIWSSSSRLFRVWLCLRVCPLVWRRLCRDCAHWALVEKAEKVNGFVKEWIFDVGIVEKVKES